MLEHTILQRLMHDRSFWDVVLPHIKTEYFESHACQEVFKVIREHADQYDSQATMEVINIKLDIGKYHEQMWALITDLKKKLTGQPEQMDPQFLLDETQKWMRSRACYLTIFDAVSIYDDPERFAELGAIPDKLNDAISVGFDEDLGDEYWVTTAQHYENVHSEGFKIPFLSKTLNELTGGGAEAKSLNALSAGINVGKTTCLISLATDYLEQGYDVVYFSAEIAEDKIHHRFDPRITQQKFDQLRMYNKMEYLSKIAEVRQKKGWGRLFIKEYPLGTMRDCDAYLKRLKRKHGVVPKIMMFDYLTEFTSYLLPHTAMRQTDLYYGSVCREMRALMFKWDACGWTATQLQRSVQNTIEASLDNVADSITIPKVLDFLFMISVPEEYEAMNLCHNSIEKSRYGGKQHFQMMLDQDTQTYCDPPGGVSIIGSLSQAKTALAETANTCNNHENEKAPKQMMQRLKGTADTSKFSTLKT